MNLHQVLTGAVNPGDHCFSVGSVGDQRFTVREAGSGEGQGGQRASAHGGGGRCCVERPGARRGLGAPQPAVSAQDARRPRGLSGLQRGDRLRAAFTFSCKGKVKSSLVSQGPAAP